MASAQKSFLIFILLTVISFQLLSGNLITLFALKLGVDNFLIGLLFSFIYMAQILPFFGRIIVRKLGAVRTLGVFWLVRYILMVPILLAPIFATRGNTSAAVTLIILSVIGFNLARGIGITAHNPIIGGITNEKNRGSFLSRNQLVVHAGVIFTGVITALLLGEDSSLYIYSILIFAGIVSGLTAGVLAFRFPEPPESSHKAVNLVPAIKTVMQRKASHVSFCCWLFNPSSFPSTPPFSWFS